MALISGFFEEAFFRKFLVDRAMHSGQSIFLQIAFSALAFGAVHAVWGLMGGRIRGAIGAMTATTDSFHATTVACVRHKGRVALAGDGQVSIGQTIVKAGARKVRKVRIISGSLLPFDGGRLGCCRRIGPSSKSCSIAGKSLGMVSGRLAPALAPTTWVRA